MATSVLVPDDDDVSRLSTMTDAELVAEFRRLLGASVENYVKAAKVIRIAEERGVDMSQFQCAVLDVLRKVAYGQLIPGLLGYCGSTSLFRKLSALPIPDQEKIAKTGRLRLIEGVTDDGTFIVREVPVLDVRPAQIKQVFGKDGLLSDEQQWQQIKGNTIRPERDSVKLTFTPKEFKKLTAAAARKDMNLAAMIRECLSAADLI